jgi:hypothetical protein
MIPPSGNHSVQGHFWIPIDHESCWTWSYDYHPIRELAEAEVAAMREDKGIHIQCIPGTYQPIANKSNERVAPPKTCPFPRFRPLEVSRRWPPCVWECF